MHDLALPTATVGSARPDFNRKKPESDKPPKRALVVNTRRRGTGFWKQGMVSRRGMAIALADERQGLINQDSDRWQDDSKARSVMPASPGHDILMTCNLPESQPGHGSRRNEISFTPKGLHRSSTVRGDIH
jgi:hypothetical protein